MPNIDIGKAESCFIDLINKTIRGNEIIITKEGQPIVKMIAFTKKQKKMRKFGSAKGLIKMADNFDETPEDFQEYI